MGGHCHCCSDCTEQDGTASTATGTGRTTSPQTATASAPTASTASSSRGIPAPLAVSPYWDIVADIVLLLHGGADEGLVYDSPFLKLAAEAVKYELADRLFDGVNVADPSERSN